MNLTATQKAATVGVLAGTVWFFLFGWFLIGSAAPAGAPQMVANELAAQRDLGYEPCEPQVGQIPADHPDADGVYAWAGGTQPGETCIVEFSVSMPGEALEWIPWHEVCHLSTLNKIYADPHRPVVDAAHTHPAFQWCIAQGPAETGGYLL